MRLVFVGVSPEIVALPPTTPGVPWLMSASSCAARRRRTVASGCGSRRTTARFSSRSSNGARSASRTTVDGRSWRSARRRAVRADRRVRWATEGACCGRPSSPSVFGTWSGAGGGSPPCFRTTREWPRAPPSAMEMRAPAFRMRGCRRTGRSSHAVPNIRARRTTVTASTIEPCQCSATGQRLTTPPGRVPAGARSPNERPPRTSAAGSPPRCGRPR
jgi:hypothetical protein